MAYINKKDTQGTKPLLAEGELGYDKYVAGGDVGRVYVGTGSENIALATLDDLSNVSGTTNISVTHSASTVVVNSSTGADGTINAATQTLSGVMSNADKTKLDGIATNANNYSLPEATSTVRGGIELFSDTDQTVAANAVTATASRTYGIQLNAAGQGVINVPWTDTDTIYTHPTTDGNLHVPATGTTNSGKVLTAGATAGSLSWTTPTVGTVTSVTAGNGMTQSGTSTINPTLNVVSHAGTAGSIGTINVSADAIGVNLGTTSTTAARGDHTHSYAGSSSAGGAATTALACTGNATTATTLQTARTIGGVSFNGSANINLPGVNTAGNQSTTGDLTGSRYVSGGEEKPNNAIFGAGKLRYQMLSSTNLGTGVGSWNDVLWVSSYTGSDVKGSNALIMSKDNDYIGVSRSNYDATAWSVPKRLAYADGTGASGTWGISVTGNASTATKLATARTINGVSFDGTANITAPTNLAEGTRTTTAVPITSSTGTGATLSAASTSLAGVMTSADKTKLDGIAAGAQVNVATNLGITAGTTAGPIVTSSTGTNATLPTASGTASGVVTTGAQTWAGEKTFSSNPISSATQSTATNALTRKDYVDTKAPLASPTFTGTPTAPTPAVSDNSTKVATTAYVQKELDLLRPSGSTIYTGAYGLNWNETNDTYTRTGVSNFTAIQSLMRRCVLNANGTVNYYLDPYNSNYKADGSPSKLDGTDGNVMVEVPKIYYKYNYNTTSGVVHEHSISLTPDAGYTVHDAWVRGGVEVDYRYYPAYLGYSSGGKLWSRSGVYPTVSQTRAQFRTLARANGAGWEQIDFLLYEAITLLMVIEYGTMNIQSALGQGRTRLSGGAWSNGSYIGINGLSNSLGNGSGNVTYTGDADDAAADGSFMSYRGCENFFGNVWRFVDGINCQGNMAKLVYLNQNPATYADDVFTGDYVSIGVTTANANGYARTLGNTRKGFIPVSVSGGSSSVGTTDYFYTSSTVNTLAVVGGSAYYGLNAGPLALLVNAAVSLSDVDVSAGVCR